MSDEEEFDYGKKLPNGQFERYPTTPEGELKLPVRHTYEHKKCGTRTTTSNAIANSYARDPSYYTHTYCAGCKDHLPVSEFVWVDQGRTTQKVVGGNE